MPGLLEVEDLVVSFGRAFSVGPIRFALDRGLLYLEGPNGGGKTTLMRAMAGELQPAGGSVRVRGQAVHRSIEARRQIALVPSAAELPDFLSVAEAAEFTAAIRGVRRWDARAYLDALNIDPDLVLGSASSGQRRKAELVCGLAGDPAVLLLDETFTHLDTASVGILKGWVNEWSATRVVVFTHHGEPPVDPDVVVHVGRPGK